MNTLKQYLNNIWAPTLGLILGLFFIILPIIGYDLSCFPGDLGDGRFNMYILEHAHRFLTFQTPSLWNAPFMFPEPNVIAFSDNLIGTVPIYSTFRILGNEREVAYILWFATIMVLNYISCYLFLYDTVKNKYAATIGAFIFAFSLSIVSQVAHVQMFPRFAVPLAFWMGVKFYTNLDVKYFFLCVLFLVYQMYCGIYLGLFLLIAMAIFILLTVAFKYKLLMVKIRQLKWSSLMVASIVINIALILPLMIPYYEMSKRTGYSDFQMVFATIPPLKSYFFSPHGSLLWNSISRIGFDIPAWWDHQIFPGIFALLSMLVMCLFLIYKTIKQEKVDHVTALMLLSFLAVFVLFLRIGNFSLYQIIYKIPGFGALRCIARIINVELIFFAFSAASLCVLLFERVKKYSGILFLFLLLFVLADNYLSIEPFHIKISAAKERENALIKKMNHLPKGSIISYEPETPSEKPFENQIDAMLASQTLKLKCINGYSGTCPGDYVEYWGKMDEASRNIWLNSKNFNQDNLFIIK